MIFQFIISGALVGFVVGATGVGGGSLMTPLLTLFFGIPASVAVGTDLLFAAITKASGAISFARRGFMPWHVVRRMAAGSIPAAIIAIVALRLWHPNASQFNNFVKPTLGVALLLTAMAVALRDQIRTMHAKFMGKHPSVSGASTLATDAPDSALWKTILAGAIIGLLVTLTSVGAGAIGVVALFFLYPRLSAAQLVGADILHAVPLTLVAGLGHVALGTVNFTMLAGLLVGSLPAIQLGALLASRLPERRLRLFLSGMLGLIGARMLFF